MDENTQPARLPLTIHGILDHVQSLLPERLRRAVRPYYLPIYYSIFPAGKPAIRSSPPRSLEPATNRPKDPTLDEYTPKVSVILPVWNHGRLLAGSIASILDQTYSNLELIVVDDGSEEDLEPVFRGFAHDPRMRVLRRPHEGLPKALSSGFQHATGNFFTWTSADNLMKPAMLERLTAFLKQNPDVDMVYANMDLIDEHGDPVYHSRYRVSAQRAGHPNELLLPRSIETLANDNFIGASFLYRSTIGRAIGSYDGARLGTEDYDYWLRMSLIGKIEHLDSDECLYSYRIHPDSLTGRHGEAVATHAAQLVADHRLRIDFHQQRFEILVQLDAGNGGYYQTADQLIDALLADRHHVTVSRRPHEAETWLSEHLPTEKRILIWLDQTNPCPDLESLFTFRISSDATAGDPYLIWILCKSMIDVENLRPPFTQNWTLLPSTSFRYDDLILCRKARDSRFMGGDVAELCGSLIVCLAPFNDALINWQLLDSVIASCPECTFLMIANSPDHSVDPRTKLTNAASVRYLGWKSVSEWPAYLSRAELLVAPFLDSDAVSSHIWDVMMTYLAAGKPTLATPALARAGFQDAPNTFIASHADSPTKVHVARAYEPDLHRADKYLETKSPSAWAKQLIGTANTRLHFIRSRSRL